VSPLDRKAVRELTGMKSQTFTIALVAACGIIILISYLTAYDSLRHAVELFYRSSRFADVFAFVKLAPNSLVPNLLEIDGVDVLETRILSEATLILPGVNEPVTARLHSLPDAGPEILNRVHLTRGRMPAPNSPGEAIVSEAFAKANRLAPGSEFAAVINGRLQRLNVVGIGLSPEYVYVLRNGSMMPDDKHFGIVWMSEKTLSEMLNYQGTWNSLSIRLRPGASASDVIRNLDRILNRYGGIGAYARKDQASNMLLESEMTEIETMAVALPTIFLGVAAFLLNVVLARLVSRQREQIATLKALGYSSFSIALHYFKIVTMMVLLGVLLGFFPGVWLGRAMTNLYTDYFRFPSLDYVFTPLVPVLAITASLGAALLGAFTSLRDAFRLAPAEAMRPPAPPAYQRSLIEYAARNLSAKTKMAVRNSTMRPMRTALSILGLSFSLGILLIGLFWSDTISFLIRFQFNFAQREDVTVVFNNLVSGKSINELRSIPGVLYAEGYRMVPVRFQNGNLTEDAALIGIPESSRLRPLFNVRMQRIVVPPDSLLMNVRMAERLHVRPGEIIQVEILEGQKRVVPVVLTLTVEELLGMGAYMEMDTLHRLMKEDDALSTAALTIDPRLADSLFIHLKGLPLVSSVDSKGMQLVMFRKIITDMLLIMGFFFVGFASVIAVGVVYNMVMVSLSERSWELASLRVLGFTRDEVFRVLVG